MVNKKLTNVLKKFLISTLLSIVLIVNTTPRLVRALEMQIDEQQNPGKRLGSVKSKGENGKFSQIYYTFDGKEKQLTDNNFTNADPEKSEGQITWMSQVGSNWQIFVYDIKSESTQQLTTIGNNVNPKIDKGYIVWESKNAGEWQIYLYDGVRITALSDGTTPAQNATILNGKVGYSKLNLDTNMWEVYIYDIQNKSTTMVSGDYSGKNVQMYPDAVFWTSLIDKQAVKLAYVFETKEIITLQDYYNLVANKTPSNEVVDQNLEGDLDGDDSDLVGLIEIPESSESTPPIDLDVLEDVEESTSSEDVIDSSDELVDDANVEDEINEEEETIDEDSVKKDDTSDNNSDQEATNQDGDSSLEAQQPVKEDSMEDSPNSIQNQEDTTDDDVAEDAESETEELLDRPKEVTEEEILEELEGN